MMTQSPPFSTPKFPKPQERSTISWPIPQPTDVLSYSYLFAREAEAERDEGVKDRPVVVVLSTTVRDGLTRVIVAPVTTKQPQKSDNAVEIPQSVKAHLGLDADRCWIITSEVNQFVWPGPDIRLVPLKSDRTPFYGKIPAKLLEKMREVISANVEQGRLKITPRSQ